MGRNSNATVIELDGESYLCRKGCVTAGVDVQDANGECWLVSDMQESISGMMAVDSASKYADLMVRRHLQESGEFEEPVSVISHWKRKLGKDATEILYTAIPTRIHKNYTELVQRASDNILVFPIYGVLFGVIKHLRSKQPIAVVFQHGRFADMVIGSKSRVYEANRYAAFDDSDDQIQSLWETLRSAIRSNETNHRVQISRVILLDWIDSGPAPDEIDEDGRRWSHLPKEPLTQGETTSQISLLTAIRQQSARDSLNPAGSLARYYANKFAPLLNVVMLLAAGCLFAGYLFFNQQNTRLEHQARSVGADIAAVQLPKIAATRNTASEEIFQFVDRLAHYQKVPSYRQVLNDIEDAAFPGLRCEVFKIDYDRKKMTIEIFGPVNAPFEAAHAGYQAFLHKIKTRGYEIIEKQFDTTIDRSTVLVKLTKAIS